MLLGAHVSIAGGFDKCIDRIVDLGGNTLMTFASSPRSLQTKEFSVGELELYQNKKQKNSIGPHFFHGVYLINLATSKPDYLQASIDSLIFYQKLAQEIGGVGTIFHIGSHQGRGFNSVFPQITDAIKRILDHTSGPSKLYLENAAGHQGVIGDNFEELSQIMNVINVPDRLAVCLDTQHAFASGIPISNLLRQFDSQIGLKHLGVIHFNESLVEFNSHRDRHANLGEGKIGLSEMKAFLNSPQLTNIPFILETPGQNHSGPRKQDLDILKSLQNK